MTCEKTGEITEQQEEDLQTIVFARTPSGVVTENVAYPNRDTELSLRVNHQSGPRTTISIRYEHTFDNVFNRVNYAGFVGNLSSDLFGLPSASRPTRRRQLRFGFEF